VTVVEPDDRADVVRIAVPPLICAVPSTVFPAVNVTGPVGLTVGEVILAVNVTVWPRVDGFGDDDKVVVLVAWLTT